MHGPVSLLVHSVGGRGSGSADERARSQSGKFREVEWATHQLRVLSVQGQGARNGLDSGNQGLLDRHEARAHGAGADVAASNGPGTTSSKNHGRVSVRHRRAASCESGRRHLKGDVDEEHKERHHADRGPPGTAWIPHTDIAAAADEGARCATKVGLSQNGYGR